MSGGFAFPISDIVGTKSEKSTRSLHLIPRGIVPGQFRISGTCVPPSVAYAFSPLRDSLLYG